jgi:hypothetical protein
MPRTPANDGSTSICTQPEYALIWYHWFGAGAHSKVIPAVRALIDTIDMPEIDRDRLKGEMIARFLALKRGELTPIRHIIGPMDTVKGLEMFEVRGGVSFGTSGNTQVRVYHVEPSALQRTDGTGSVVVGVHLHHKEILEGVDPNIAQDAELQTARKRYFDGQSGNWGGASIAKRI